MQEMTRRFIEDLSRIDWFKNVGKLDEGGVFGVHSLAEAKKYCSTNKWINFTTTIGNRYCQKLWSLNVMTSKEHNHVADEINSTIFKLFKGGTKKMFGSLVSDPDLCRNIRGDIQGVAFEIEYSQNVRPLFFYPVVWPWYQRGHLICGWDGKMISRGWAGNGPEDLPEGRVRVY